MNDKSPNIGDTSHTVLSATGLPRQALQVFFKTNGLFGAESALSKEQQDLLLRALGQPTGIHPVIADARNALHPMLSALCRYAQQAVAGRGIVPISEWEQAREGGISAAALNEVLMIVGIVRDVFSLPTAPVPSTESAPLAKVA